MALNSSNLKKAIEQAVKDHLTPALESGLKCTMNNSNSDLVKETCKNFAETVVDLFAENFADCMAEAIDTYMHGIEFSGTVTGIGNLGAPVVSVIQGGHMETTKGIQAQATGKMPGNAGIVYK